MTAVMTITGVEELEKSLKKLPLRVRKKHLRRALRRASALVRDEIKSTAPVGEYTRTPGYRKGQNRPKPGRLRRLVRIRVRRGGRGYLKTSLFYPTIGKGNDPKNAYYWRFLEFGTKYIPAHRYIQGSVDRKFRQVVSTVISETNAGVAEELRSKS